VERTALFDQKRRKRTKNAIRKALELQMEGRGFSLVEVLAECPTPLKVPPLEAEKWVREKMVPIFPLGVLKDEERESWFRLPKPCFEARRTLEVTGMTREKPPRFCRSFPEHLDPEEVALKLAGAGGDGAQTAALLLTKAAIHEGFDATHIPSYGPESRGGTSYADVRIAREEVLSPAAPHPHVLVAFNAPSLQKFGPAVREGGAVVYDSGVITETPPLPEGVRVFPVPFGEIAKNLGRVLVKNMVALGAVQEATGILAEESLLTAIRESLRENCAMVEINEEAFRWGVRAVREGITRS
jgi:2-oxoisovalerate ferredoxin oxidoreductase beta subunit